MIEKGKRPVTKSFGDIPLRIAMIGWNWMPPDGDGRIQVVPWPDGDRWLDRLDLTCTTGACWTYWQKAPLAQLRLKLMLEAWHIVARDGLCPEHVHEALLVIPEYRKMLAEDMPGIYLNEPTGSD